jgi:tetratricopeptide (TPR) repeat protein
MADDPRLLGARRQYQAAVSLHREGKLREAERCYLAVQHIYPGHPGALHGLGLIALREGRYEKAIGYLRRAIAAAPRNGRIRIDLGQALLQSGQYNEALGCFREVLAAEPGNAAALAGAGDALNILGRSSEARDVFERLLTAEPESAAGQFGLGTALAQLGRNREAREHLELAVARAPRRAVFHRALAEIERFTDDDPRLVALEKLALETLPDHEKIELHFALAKAYDDLKRYREAFGHLGAGNALKRQYVSYDEEQARDSFRGLTTAFTAEFFEANKNAGNPSELPIFVLGMPRSGTSLVEQILASDPAVFGAGELTTVQDLVAEGRVGDRYPQTDDLATAALRGFGDEYLSRLAPGAARIVDKMPGNFRYIGLIHLALPRARIVHVRRDPADTCFSCYSKLFLNGLNYTYELGELGRYYRMYEALMAHWRAVLPEGAMLDVQYELLVGSFESEARRIVEYCGLEWSDRFLEFHRNDRAVRTHSQAQVRQPLFASSIGRWRAYEEWLQPLLEGLNQPDAK